MSHIYRKQHGCMIKDRSNIVLVRKSLWMICYVLLMVMHALEMHALEMHALEMHALEMHALEMHALEMHALEMHALEMHAPAKMHLLERLQSFKMLYALEIGPLFRLCAVSRIA